MVTPDFGEEGPIVKETEVVFFWACGIAPDFDLKTKLSLSESVELAPSMNISADVLSEPRGFEARQV